MSDPERQLALVEEADLDHEPDHPWTLGGAS